MGGGISVPALPTSLLNSEDSPFLHSSFCGQQVFYATSVNPQPLSPGNHINKTSLTILQSVLSF